MLADELRGAGEVDAVAVGEGTEDLLDPGDAFEPPVAEELRVVCRADEAVVAARLAVPGDLRLDESGKVATVFFRAPKRLNRIVDLLLVQLDARSGDPPVVQPGLAVLLVELAIERIAWIAVLCRPDLQPRRGVASDRRHAGLRHPVRLERRALHRSRVVGDGE